MAGCIDGWMYIWIDGCTDGRMYVRIYVCIYAICIIVCISAWLTVDNQESRVSDCECCSRFFQNVADEVQRLERKLPVQFNKEVNIVLLYNIYC